MADGIATSFVWTIKNFDMCPHLRGHRLYGPKFSVGSYLFRLHLCPRGTKNPKYISAYLERLDDCGTTNVSVRQKLYLVDKTLCSHCKFRSRRRIYKIHDIWGCDSLIKRDTLFTMQRQNFLPYNNLTLKCELLLLPKPEDESEEKEPKFNNQDEEKKFDNQDEETKFNNQDEETKFNFQDAEILSSDFAKILDSGNYSDMVLAVDENKFSVHKAIVQCRCPKLLSQLNETDVANEYSLDDIKAPVLQTLLSYLYTGILSTAEGALHEGIFIACNAYNIPDLKDMFKFAESKTVTAFTEITFSRLSFTLPVVNFSKLQMGDILYFPAFYFTEDEWCKMGVFLTVVQSGIEINLKKMNANEVKFIRCRMSIYSPIETMVKEYEHFFKDQDFIIPLLSQNEICKILYDDTMDIFFEVFVSKEEPNNSKIEGVSVNPPKIKTGGGKVIKNLKQFQRDLLRLLNYRDFADIAIRAGNAEYYAHKVVMCARSRVFAKMFENNTLESEEGVVTIEDIDPNTVLSMLRYIYSGCIDNIGFSEVTKLYTAADKYELLSLRDKCAFFLKTSVDSENVGEMLLLANAHCDESLKRCVYDYITANPKKILESIDGLSVLKSNLDQYPDLINVFLEYMSLKDEN